jgi:hypothetical protein
MPNPLPAAAKRSRRVERLRKLTRWRPQCGWRTPVRVCLIGMTEALGESVSNRSLRILALLLALGAAGSLSAMMIQLPPRELTARADVIVTGNVAGVTSQWDDSHATIFTDVAVSVERLDKGNAPARLTVRVPGGEVGDVGMAVEDMPTFVAGQRVTLYLSRTSDHAIFSLVGGGQAAAKGGGHGGPGGPKLYSYSGYHRDPASCYYYINEALPSTWFSALENAGDTWSNAGSPFRFYYESPTDLRGPSADGYNVICDSDMGNNGILAANYYWYNRHSKIVTENDIVFNIYYPWSTDSSAGYYQVQNIGTHEMGHCLLLNDLYSQYQSEQTMYGYGAAGETKKQTLESGDVDGIEYIYGAGF